VTAPWTALPVLSIDCESTGVNPFTAHVVELGAVEVHPDGSTAGEWHTVVDPGVEIPEGAAAIHGITTEQARAEGVDPNWALMLLAERLVDHVKEHDGQAGVVVFNARYDLPLLIAECGRHGVDWPAFAGILDPLTLDRMADFYRRDEVRHFKPVAHTHTGGFEQARQHRNGRRKLGILADRYGVELSEDDAHGALADATAAGQILWRLIERFPQIAQHSLSTLWLKQVQGAERERDRLQDWIRQNRDPSADLPGGWPIPNRVERDTAPAPALAGAAS
jgi:DNA polymerase-3 subunit epsilon